MIHLTDKHIAVEIPDDVTEVELTGENAYSILCFTDTEKFGVKNIILKDNVKKMKVFETPKDISSFMQNAEGEVIIRKNDVYLDGVKVGEFHFTKNINKKTNEKLRITKIRIVGNKDFSCDVLVDNIAVFRMRTAITFKTNAKNVMFTYYDGENKIDELNKEALK